jgi:hypothetical protein
MIQGVPSPIDRSAVPGPRGQAIDINMPGFLEPGPPIGLFSTPFGINPAQSIMATFSPTSPPGFSQPNTPVSSPVAQDPRASLATQQARDLAPTFGLPGPSMRDVEATRDREELERSSPQVDIPGAPETTLSHSPAPTSAMMAPSASPELAFGPPGAVQGLFSSPGVEPSAPSLAALSTLSAPSITSAMLDPTSMSFQSPVSLASLPGRDTFADRFAGTPGRGFTEFQAPQSARDPDRGREPGREPGRETEPDRDREPAPPAPPGPVAAPGRGTAPAPGFIGLSPGIVDPFGDDFRRRLALARAAGLV